MRHKSLKKDLSSTPNSNAWKSIEGNWLYVNYHKATWSNNSYFPSK